MDILTIFLLFFAATAVGGFAYIIVWIVNTVRRVGVLRFTGAGMELVKAVLKAFLKVFKSTKPESKDKNNKEIDYVLLAEYLRMAQEGQKLTEDSVKSTMPKSDLRV
jgi:hypothetical protein